MKRTLRLSSILLVMSILTGCSSSSSKGKTYAELEEEKTIHDIDQLLKDLPPPSLVPFTLKSIDAKFDKEHINSLGKFENYEGNADKMALNLGVYASDIIYLAAYGHEDECISYLETAHAIAEKLGDSTIYDQSHLDEFRRLIKNGDKKEISKLLAKLFMETSIKMEESHYLSIAGLALTGSFVEGLYQAVITLETYDDSKESKKLLEPLVKIIIGEKNALRDIIQVLDDLPFDDVIAEMMIELKTLDELYNGDLKDIKLKMTEDSEFIVSKDLMKDISAEVKRIRALIVK